MVHSIVAVTIETITTHSNMTSYSWIYSTTYTPHTHTIHRHHCPILFIYGYNSVVAMFCFTKARSTSLYSEEAGFIPALITI